MYLWLFISQLFPLQLSLTYISFLHAGDKSHHEACLHLPQFLYFAALLSCFAAPHIIFPLERVWQFVQSLLSPLRLVVCVVMGGTVCTVGRHVCVCVHYSSVGPVHTYTFIGTIYTYTVCMYVIVLSMRYCHRYHHLSSICSRTNIHTYIHTYVRTSLPFLLGSGLSWWHSCHLRHWQQSTTSPLSTRTCWQTTDTTPSMCGRTSSSTWPNPHFSPHPHLPSPTLLPYSCRRHRLVPYMLTPLYSVAILYWTQRPWSRKSLLW